MLKNIYLYLTKIINLLNSIITDINIKIKNIFPEKFIYIYMITFWVFLLIIGYINETRLIKFCIVLLIISIYKILHKNINNWYNYFRLNLKKETLIKIYKYKNPLLLILIIMELKLSNIIYNITKKNIQYIYKKIIYNILYYFTGFNGLKIIICKYYVILNDWKNANIYEIIFKRMYGMILSVLIFTNIIQLILLILKAISTNIFIWIYLILVIISYIMEIPNIRNIEYFRKESNFIWLILIKDKNAILINAKNQDIQILMGILGLNLSIGYILNYGNYLKYLMVSYDDKFNYNKLSYSYCYEIQNILFETEYIFTKNAKLKKVIKNQKDIALINYCEYQILLYKIILFYIWDVEKALALEIKETLLKIEKEEIDFIGESLFTYNYNINKFHEIYYKKIDSVKLNKFWDLIENRNFYEKILRKKFTK